MKRLLLTLVLLVAAIAVDVAPCAGDVVVVVRRPAPRAGAIARAEARWAARQAKAAARAAALKAALD